MVTVMEDSYYDNFMDMFENQHWAEEACPRDGEIDPPQTEVSGSPKRGSDVASSVDESDIQTYESPAPNLSNQPTEDVRSDENAAQELADHEPLVAKDDTSPQIRIPIRLIIVEPFIVAFVLFNFPSSATINQYLLETVAKEIGGNLTANQSACSANHSDPDYIFTQTVQSHTSYQLLYFQLVNAVPSILMSLFLGGYSDRAGRKYAMLPPLVGFCVLDIFYLLVINFKLSLRFLYIAYFISGCFGYQGTVTLGVISYISDVTTAKTRSFRITVAQMCNIGPVVLSSIGTGIWINYMGFAGPFIFAIAGNFITMMYGLFGIPETIIKDPETKFFSFVHITDAGSVLIKDDGSNRRWKLALLMLAIFFPLMTLVGDSVDVLFLRNVPLCWESDFVGYELAVDISAMVFGGLAVTIFFKKCLHLSDVYIVLISGCIAVIRYGYKASVQNTAMMFSVSVLSMFTIIFLPMLKSVVSSIVTRGEYGSIFGCLAVVEAICTVAGYAIFNPIYAATTSFMSGFVFIIMGVCYVIGTILVGIYLIFTKRENKKRTA